KATNLKQLIFAMSRRLATLPYGYVSNSRSVSHSSCSQMSTYNMTCGYTPFPRHVLPDPQWIQSCCRTVRSCCGRFDICPICLGRAWVQVPGGRMGWLGLG